MHRDHPRFMFAEYYDKFVTSTSRWKSAYTHAVKSYVAFKTSQGTHLLFGKVRLETASSLPAQAPISFEREHLLAGTTSAEIRADDVERILANAKNGQLEGPQGPLTLAMDQGRDRFDFYWYPTGKAFPSTLRVSGARPHSGVNDQELDWEVQTGEIPFASLDELLSMLGLPSWNRGSEATTLQIAAASPASILPTSRIAKGAGVIDLLAAKALDTTKLRLGLQVAGKDAEPERLSTSGREIEWRDRQNSKIASYTITVGDALTVRAFLSHEGILIDECSLSDPQKQPNLGSAVHRVADPNFSLLQKLLLDPGKRDANEFENAVSLLLNMLGLSAAHYGLMRDFREGPDIIALSPSGNLLVIECTTGFPDVKDKLTKLTGRISRIKTALMEAGHANCEILPMLVTSLPRDEVKANIQNAEELGVAVVCKEELQNALQLVVLRVDGEEIFAKAKKLIPVAVYDPFRIR